MQRSSETIGAIASALAKAQIEIDRQSGEVADGHDPVTFSRRSRPQFPLRFPVQWA